MTEHYVVWRRRRNQRSAWQEMLSSKSKGSLLRQIGLSEMNRGSLDDPEYEYAILPAGEKPLLTGPKWMEPKSARRRF
jgi:hypothetical protein